MIHIFSLSVFIRFLLFQMNIKHFMNCKSHTISSLCIEFSEREVEHFESYINNVADNYLVEVSRVVVGGC